MKTKLSFTVFLVSMLAVSGCQSPDNVHVQRMETRGDNSPIISGVDGDVVYESSDADGVMVISITKRKEVKDAK